MTNYKTTMKCDCAGWQHSAPQAFAQWEYCGKKRKAPKYFGLQAVFCPWCGKKLKPNIAELP
jgi:hypothetical protein